MSVISFSKYTVVTVIQHNHKYRTKRIMHDLIYTRLAIYRMFWKHTQHTPHMYVDYYMDHEGHKNCITANSTNYNEQ